MKFVSTIGFGVLLCVGSVASELRPVERFSALFEPLPGSAQKPTSYWVAKSLDRLADVPNPTREAMKKYLGLATKGQALAAILADHEQGFKTRLYSFGLRYIEFLPDALYSYDPATGDRVFGRELSAFPNVQRSADGVWRGGDFYALYDFPLEDLRFRGYPFSTNAAESQMFVTDWLNKPFFRVLTNSLTNKNRKRAAWLLRNFLCDDLSSTSGSDEKPPAKAVATPTAPPELGSHPPIKAADARNNRHASELGCKSCHWKLDYIGSFFRYFDSWGNNYQKRGKYLEFADQAIYRDQSWDEWMADWRTPDGRWYAGVHRKALAPDPADWDATTVNRDPVPEVLFQFFKTDPEANRCLTKRMAESFIGSNLTYDVDWLGTLSQRFGKRAPTESGTAFIEVLGTLAFSRSFVTPNPDPDSCYDTAAGQTPRRIPCGVFKVLRTQCLSCHDDKSLNINFSDLVERKGGQLWLDHDGADGNPLSPEESYRIVKDRLFSSDPKKRMPYGKPPLSTRDSQRLLDWMEGLKGHP